MVFSPPSLLRLSTGMGVLSWVGPKRLYPSLAIDEFGNEGDKANHIPALHIPQLFYFYAFSTAFGMPSLMFSGCGETAGPVGLIREIVHRIGGTPR